MSESDNFIPLVIIQCIRLSGSGEMDTVSVKTGRAKGCTDSRVAMQLENMMSKSDNFILLDRIQCIRLSGSGEMHSVSVKTGRVTGCTDSRVRM